MIGPAYSSTAATTVASASSASARSVDSSVSRRFKPSAHAPSHASHRANRPAAHRFTPTGFNSTPARLNEPTPSKEPGSPSKPPGSNALNASACASSESLALTWSSASSRVIASRSGLSDMRSDSISSAKSDTPRSVRSVLHLTSAASYLPRSLRSSSTSRVRNRARSSATPRRSSRASALISIVASAANRSTSPLLTCATAVSASTVCASADAISSRVSVAADATSFSRLSIHSCRSRRRVATNSSQTLIASSDVNSTSAASSSYTPVPLASDASLVAMASRSALTAVATRARATSARRARSPVQAATTLSCRSRLCRARCATPGRTRWTPSHGLAQLSLSERARTSAAPSPKCAPWNVGSSVERRTVLAKILGGAVALLMRCFASEARSDCSAEARMRCSTSPPASLVSPVRPRVAARLLGRCAMASFGRLGRWTPYVAHGQ